MSVTVFRAIGSLKESGKNIVRDRLETELYTWCVQVLRSPKEAFAAAMQSWRERCEKCAFVGATVQRRPNVV